MTENLARLQDTSVDELVQISAAMETYIQTESDGALSTTLDRLDRKPGIINRLFPGAYEKELQRVDIARLATSAAARDNIFVLYTEVQLEIARKQGDALIASVGMHLQAALTTFATEQMDSVTKTIIGSRLAFLRSYVPQLDEAEQYRTYPDLYEDLRESLVAQQKMYFATIEKLLKGFVEALDTKVKRP